MWTDSSSAAALPVARREDFIDWLRALMIVLVVYAHVDLTIGPLGAGVPEYVVDDLPRGDDSSTSLGTRWISFARPWCLPLLFWISGASMAFQRSSARMLSSVTWLCIFTAVGMLLNAAIWFLGPADPSCSPYRPCVGRGVLFQFSVCAFSGHLFPIVFQMWYTLILTAIILWCYPFLRRLSGESCNTTDLVIQWVASCSVYIVCLWGSACPHFIQCAFQLCSLEAMFIAAAHCTLNDQKRTSFLSIRLLHYCMGAILVLQFGATEFATSISALSLSFVLYVTVGFKQFFLVGFVMMRSKLRGDVNALVSQAWPLALLLAILFAPSTNWIRGGNLTYPYFPQARDRCLYIGGAVVVIFILDRIGHTLQCIPLPTQIQKAGLALYLVHPTLMACILQFTPLQAVGSIWGLCLTIVGLPFIVCFLATDVKPQKSESLLGPIEE